LFRAASMGCFPVYLWPSRSARSGRHSEGGQISSSDGASSRVRPGSVSPGSVPHNRMFGGGISYRSGLHSRKATAPIVLDFIDRRHHRGFGFPTPLSVCFSKRCPVPDFQLNHERAGHGIRGSSGRQSQSDVSPIILTFQGNRQHSIKSPLSARLEPRNAHPV
jgi:hypothetical protein